MVHSCYLTFITINIIFSAVMAWLNAALLAGVAAKWSWWWEASQPHAPPSAAPRLLDAFHVAIHIRYIATFITTTDVLLFMRCLGLFASEVVAMAVPESVLKKRRTFEAIKAKRAEESLAAKKVGVLAR